ncbi:hypothetical protein HDU98_004405 [Podochytrium sp. JEL0797]|nr:hypothetical protein HDU98_004405 [Podochytrium sp. JEL0797]
MESVLNRLAQSARLRTTVLRNTTNTPSSIATTATTHPTPRIRHSIASKMLNYHIPDVNLVGLSNQDASLSGLELKDVWMQSRVAREEDFLKRGKVVRVGVLSGRWKPAADDGKGKKKKKK